METLKIAFLVLALGAFILAGVLTYNLLTTPDYVPINQGQAIQPYPQQYVQQPIIRNAPTKPKTVDSVQAYAAFQVMPEQ